MSGGTVTRWAPSRWAAWVVLLAACSDTRNAEAPPQFSENPDGGAPVDAAPVPDVPRVLINEVSSAGDYVELFNIGPPVDLGGWSVADALFDPLDPAGSIGQRHVLPSGTLVTGGRSLIEGLPFGVGGTDTITLFDADAIPIDRLSWQEGQADPAWGRLPDGASRVGRCTATPGGPNAPPTTDRCGDGVVDPGEACDGPALGGATCARSGLGAGSLACTDDCAGYHFDDCGRGGPPAVRINELSSSDDDPIELINMADAAVDLGGWRLSDDDATQRLRTPSLLAPGARFVLRKDDAHALGLGDADTLTLADPLGRAVDATTWPANAADRSWCRVPDGVGAFQACGEATLGAANVAGPARCGDGQAQGDEPCDGPELRGADCVALGFDGGTLTCADDCTHLVTALCTALARVRINEVSAVGDDAIELYNAGAAPVDVGGWAVADGQFDPTDPEDDHRHFLPESTLEPGGYLLLLKDQDHGFGLGAHDAVTLFDAGGQAVDHTRWPDGAADPAWCRLPDGDGDFSTCAATPGGTNRR